MASTSRRIVVEEASDRAIACALADLADYPTGSKQLRLNNYLDVGNSEEVAVVLHGDKLARADGDLQETIAYLGPNIVVGTIMRPPKRGETEWMPSDEYQIEFDKTVDPSLLARIGDMVRTGDYDFAR